MKRIFGLAALIVLLGASFSVSAEDWHTISSIRVTGANHVHLYIDNNSALNNKNPGNCGNLTRVIIHNGSENRENLISLAFATYLSGGQIWVSFTDSCISSSPRVNVLESRL